MKVYVVLAKQGEDTEAVAVFFDGNLAEAHADTLNETRDNYDPYNVVECCSLIVPPEEP